MNFMDPQVLRNLMNSLLPRLSDGRATGAMYQSEGHLSFEIWMHGRTNWFIVTPERQAQLTFHAFEAMLEQALRPLELEDFTLEPL